MKHALASLTIGACLLLPSASVVFAAGQPGTSAGVNCGGAGPASSGLMTPGQAAASPRSSVQRTGPCCIGSGGVGGARSMQGPREHRQPCMLQARIAVSQYDVACLQVTTHATTHANDPPAAVARPCPAHRRLQ